MAPSRNTLLIQPLLDSQSGTTGDQTRLFFSLSVSFLPGDGLWDGLGADGNLDALLPLLPPRVGKDIVVFGVQLVRVVNLHGCDQVRPENLQDDARKRESEQNDTTRSLCLERKLLWKYLFVFVV